MTTTEGISLPTNVKQTNVRHKMLANPTNTKPKLQTNTRAHTDTRSNTWQLPALPSDFWNLTAEPWIGGTKKIHPKNKASKVTQAQRQRPSFIDLTGIHDLHLRPPPFARRAPARRHVHFFQRLGALPDGRSKEERERWDQPPVRKTSAYDSTKAAYVNST